MILLRIKDLMVFARGSINLFRCKYIVNIVTFDGRASNALNQLSELTASTAEHISYVYRDRDMIIGFLK